VFHQWVPGRHTGLDHQGSSARKAEIDKDTWATLKRVASRPFDKPETGRIAVKVVNHLGDEVMQVMNMS